MSKESKKADLSLFATMIVEQVDEYANEVKEESATALHNTALRTRSLIRRESPSKAVRSDRKRYVECFGIKKDKKSSVLTETIYNTQYQLIHLLEDGHNVYIRPGGAKNPDAEKIGPLVIHKRSIQKPGVVFSPYKTGCFGAWAKGQAFAEEDIVSSFLKELNK